jgi:hypothetical protein
MSPVERLSKKQTPLGEPEGYADVDTVVWKIERKYDGR